MSDAPTARKAIVANGASIRAHRKASKHRKTIDNAMTRLSLAKHSLIKVRDDGAATAQTQA